MSRLQEVGRALSAASAQITRDLWPNGEGAGFDYDPDDPGRLRDLLALHNAVQEWARIISSILSDVAIDLSGRTDEGDDQRMEIVSDRYESLYQVAELLRNEMKRLGLTVSADLLAMQVLEDDE